MYEKLLAFSRQHSSSIFAVLYTAIAHALQQQGNLKDIVIGTSASGRTDPEFLIRWVTLRPWWRIAYSLALQMHSNHCSTISAQ